MRLPPLPPVSAYQAKEIVGFADYQCGRSPLERTSSRQCAREIDRSIWQQDQQTPKSPTFLKKPGI